MKFRLTNTNQIYVIAIQWLLKPKYQNVSFIVNAASNQGMKDVKLTTMSFPSFSGLFAILIAAAAAAPDDIPTCQICHSVITDE